MFRLHGALVVAAVAGTVAAHAAAATSPACTAATKWVARDTTLIQRLVSQRDNVTNSASVVNPVRKHQIAVQLARLRADLVKAQAAKKKACVNEPKAWTPADYDGVSGGFSGAPRIVVTFTVASGNVTGDLASTAPLDPASGNVVVQAAFAGATCDTATLHIDPATGAATTATTVKCTLGGASATGKIEAKRTG